MQELKVKTSIAANTAGDWVPTDGYTNIMVGTDGGYYSIQFRMVASGTIVYSARLSVGAENVAVVLKAYEVRVVNTGDSAINYEVYA